MRVIDMQSTIKFAPAGSRTRKLSAALAAAALLGIGASAHAQLSDDPYFNLWSTNVSYQSDVGTTTGDGTSVWLCGTDECSGVNSGAGTNTTGGTGYAYFEIIATQPTGSGYIDPFLRFQHNEQSGNGNDTVEMAYNTDKDPLQQADGVIDGQIGGVNYDFENQAKDTVAGGSKPPTGDYNHALVLSQLQVENGFLTFMLDINEPNNNCNEKNATKCSLTSTLRLDELEFFVSTTNMLSNYKPDWTSPGTAGGTFLDAGATTLKFWDMDFEKLVTRSGNDPNYGGLLLDNINDGLGSAGSGDYDLRVKVPYTQDLAAFVQQYSASGKGDDLYVYLYNFAGEAESCGPTAKGNQDPNSLGDCGEAEAGFEEWAAVMTEEPPDNGAPIPPTAFLFAAGLLGMVRRKKH